MYSPKRTESGIMSLLRPPHPTQSQTMLNTILPTRVFSNNAQTYTVLKTLFRAHDQFYEKAI